MTVANRFSYGSMQDGQVTVWGALE